MPRLPAILLAALALSAHAEGFFGKVDEGKRAMERCVAPHSLVCEVRCPAPEAGSTASGTQTCIATKCRCEEEAQHIDMTTAPNAALVVFEVRTKLGLPVPK